MEIVFHSNKCALKDALRIMRRAKNPCWKKRQQMVDYSSGLICTNKSIICLHEGISTEDQAEFKRLVDQFAAISQQAEDNRHKCFICLKDCLASEVGPAGHTNVLNKPEELSTFALTDSQPANPENPENPENLTNSEPTTIVARTNPETLPLALDHEVLQIGNELRGILEDASMPATEAAASDARTENVAEVAGRLERMATTASFIESVVTLQSEGLERSAYETGVSYDHSANNLLELEELLERKKRTLLIKRWIGAILVFFCFLSLLFLKPFLL
ncbi:hypothetical protein NEDG_00762 [Nematocida displodere]|uniref:Uncharacterized protein n=1 Tax=Nematocida displodere TaxID=1805483 RepID=A0A177EF61_9MICR|nr:hypothetical protein NEDG_00762 [Nematocida displodere]